MSLKNRQTQNLSAFKPCCSNDDDKTLASFANIVRFPVYGVLLLCMQIFSLSSNAEASSIHHETLEGLNEFSNLETAGSHGLYGFTVGAGGSRFNSASSLENSDFFSDYLADGSSKQIFIPKVWISKGLIWPFDAGISVGYLPEKHFSQLGGYLQWTVFQRFGLPAFSIQADYSKTKVGQIAGSSTMGGTAKASWGYGPISIYGAFGFRNNSTTIDTNQIPFTFTLETDHSEPSELKSNSASTSETKKAGIQFQIISTLWKLTIEKSFSSSNSEMITGKVSFGL